MINPSVDQVKPDLVHIFGESSSPGTGQLHWRKEVKESVGNVSGRFISMSEPDYQEGIQKSAYEQSTHVNSTV